jgi:colanic acid biosynthesis protein WcaH
MSAVFVPPEIFRQIVRHAPLISIDLIMEDESGRVLVGLRNNEPAAGVYFVPGGIVRKNETVQAAFRRIALTETGLDLQITAAEFLGVFEHFYDTNRFREPGFGTHYVVLGHRLKLPRRLDIVLDDQHSKLLWLSPEEILDAPDVHKNTKAYFRPFPRSPGTRKADLPILGPTM